MKVQLVSLSQTLFIEEDVAMKWRVVVVEKRSQHAACRSNDSTIDNGMICNPKMIRTGLLH